ncbi:MAG: hypothetical protein PHQ23_15050, partial [Candidatus Wallbacteria bacterium]|nr:hypothetical protein [Candidatus Wallbacteria bacterium]
FSSGSGALTCTDDFTISAGTYNGGSGKNTFVNDIWLTGGAFTATSSTTEVTGSDKYWSKEVGATFTHNSGKFVIAGSDGSTFSVRGTNAFNIFYCKTNNKTISFDKTETNTIASLQLQGEIGANLIKIVSETNGAAAPINVTASSVSCVSVKDSNNTGNWIQPTLSTNQGNNSKWFFNNVVWTGTGGATWATAGSWNVGVVPSVFDTAEIAAGTVNKPELGAAAEVARLKINAGATLKTKGFNLTVSAGQANFNNYGTLEVQGNEAAVQEPTHQSTSKIRYVGIAGADDRDIFNWTYNSTLEIAAESGDLFHLAADETIAGNLLVTAGSLTTKSGVNRQLTVSGTTRVGTDGKINPFSSVVNFQNFYLSGEVIASGGGSQTYGAGFYNSGAFSGGAAGTLTFNGAINNYTGATFTAATATTLDINSTLANAGTFSCGSAAADFAGAVTNTGTFNANTNGKTFQSTVVTSNIFNGNSAILTFNQNFTNEATFTGGTGKHTFAMNWANKDTGTYTATSGTTEITGDGYIWYQMGSVDKFIANSGTLEIKNNATIKGLLHIAGFYCATPGKTLTFGNSQTKEFDRFVIKGAAGNLINIRSLSDGNAVPVDINASNVSYASVKDSNNGTGTTVYPTSSTNLGNNTNWNFANSIFTWDGSDSNAWTLAANWDIGVAPSSYDNVKISAGTNQPSLTGITTVNKITIEASTTLSLAGFNFTTSNGFINSGTIEIKGSETITGTPTNNADSKVRYIGTGGAFDGLIKDWTYQRLQIAGGAAEVFRLPAAKTLNQTLEVTSGIFNTNGGGSDRNLTVTGPTIIAGTFTPNASDLTFNSSFTSSGTVNAGSGTHTFNGNWTSSGAYTATSGNTELNGARTWNRSGGSFTHNNGTFVAKGAGTALFQGNTGFNNFTCTEAGKQLTFTAASTQAIAGSFTITGTAGNLVKLRSTAGVYFITDNGTESVNYADVEYSTAANGITATNSKNSGNNTLWTFTSALLTWDGSTDTDWNTPANWDLGYVPNTTDRVKIPNEASDPVLASHTTVLSTEVLAGATFGLGNFNFITTADLNNAGGISSTGGSLKVNSLANTSTITMGATAALTVEVNASNSGTITMNSGKLVVTGDLTNSSNVLLAGSSFTVGGSFQNTGTLTMKGNETLSFTNDTDSGLIKYIGSGAVTDLSIIPTYYDVQIDDGVAEYTFRLSGDTQINRKMTISDGTFSPLSRNITLAAGGTIENNDTWTTATGGTFTCNGNAWFTGSAGIGFWNFSDTAAGSTLTFKNGNTYTFADGGTLTLTGAAGNLINLRSASPGAGYTFDKAGAAGAAISYVDVQDCSSVLSNSITAATSKNRSNNDVTGPVNWIFTANTLTWDGSASLDWNTTANWNEGYVPNA